MPATTEMVADIVRGSLTICLHVLREAWETGPYCARLRHTTGVWQQTHRTGDQAGELSRAGSLVRLVRPEPSAFMTYTSSLSSRLEAKAIFEPSGDHVGVRSPSPPTYHARTEGAT